MEVLFEIASGGRGGGRRVLSIGIGRKDFEALLDAMVKVDRQAAMAAMVDEMQRQVR